MHFPYRKALLVVLFLAFLIRLPGIPWGLLTFEPYGLTHSFHPDEYKIVLGARGYPKDIAIRTDFRYPTGLHYLLGILTLPLRFFKDAFPAPLDTDIYYIVGRFFVVLTGVLAVALTYQLGARILSPPVGLLASGILAISLYHVRNSSLITTDVPTSALTVLVILIALDVRADSAPPIYGWLGATIGLLIGIKYTGAFVLIPVAILLLEGFLREPDVLKKRRMLGMLAASMLLSIVVFVITTPGSIFSFAAFRDSLTYEFGRIDKVKSSLLEIDAWSYIFNTLAGSSNTLITIFSTLGLIAALGKNTRRLLLPYLALVLLYLIYFNTSLIERYVITIMPFLCLLCASFLITLLRSRAQVVRSAGILGIISLLSFGLFQNGMLVYMLQNDSRYQVSEYIHEYLPVDATIAMGKDQTERACKFNTVLGQSVILLEQKPDYVFLCGSDSLPLENQTGQYQLIAEFKRKYPINVEFVSPVVRVYRKEN